MDVLARFMTGNLRGEETGGTPGPLDKFWYNAVGAMTNAGIRVDEDGAKKLSAWFRGRDILATSLAMLPFGMYERLPGDQGRGDADQHPLHDVIHRKPNGWQDSFGWRRQLMYNLIDRGNAYCRIVPGPRGFADQLQPIAPVLVTPTLRGGRKVYGIRDAKTGITSVSLQDEIFHLMSHSEDGIGGRGVLEYAANSIGLGLVLESYSGKVFTQGGLHGGFIKVPALLDKEASVRMADSFVTGATNWHRPKVLEQGADWIANTMEPEKLQMILSKKFSINEMARYLGLPPHMLADLDRSTNNNIEQQAQEFLTYSEGPWLSCWEFGTNDQLVLRPDRFYAEFNRDAFARGDLATRWAAYVDSVTTGIFTRNEVRVMENRKKLPGLDTPLDPAFLTGKSASSQQQNSNKNQPPPDDNTNAAARVRRPVLMLAAEEAEPVSARARAIVIESAARVLRREVTAIQKVAVKLAGDREAWAVWVAEFYAQHVGVVAATLRLDAAAAEQYCAGQARQLLTSGLRVLEDWTTESYAVGLAELALDEEAA